MQSDAPPATTWAGHPRFKWLVRDRAGSDEPRRPTSSALATSDLRAEPGDRIVLPVDDSLLQRDERIVGDLDVFGADLRAALGDIAQPEAVVVLRDLLAIEGVERVHVQFGGAHEKARTGIG